jgi:Fe-S-cluster containining protein
MSDASNFIAAGDFGSWLARARASLRGNAGVDVPCGDCTGCCTSGYSVQLRPEDGRAAAKIPAAFLTQAPGFPRDHLTMRALPDGTCPMLHAGKCSIYRERPQTCLDYDCRVFAAAGIDAGGGDKAVINQRVRAWRFNYPNDADRLAHEAVLAAAAFIQEHRGSFSGRAPSAPMGIAVLAVKAYEVFLDPQISQRSAADVASAIVTANREFDAATAAIP